MLRDAKKSRPVKLQRMMLRWPGDKPVMDPDDMAEAVQALASSYGGEISIGDTG